MFRARKNWHENVKQVPIVPGMSANKLMAFFMQQKKNDCRKVVDELAVQSGIVSLEDR